MGRRQAGIGWIAGSFLAGGLVISWIYWLPSRPFGTSSLDRGNARRAFHPQKENMPLSTVEESFVLAAYYRGGSPDDRGWVSNSDQILTLSLFFTGDISSEDCVERFSKRSYVSKLYDPDGELTELIGTRYRLLISLLREHPELIEGNGDFETPTDPTYSSCRLTIAGQNVARSLRPKFRDKPEFPTGPTNGHFPTNNDPADTIVRRPIHHG